MTTKEHSDFMGYLDEWLSIMKEKCRSYTNFMNNPKAVEYNDIFNELLYMDFEADINMI